MKRRTKFILGISIFVAAIFLLDAGKRLWERRHGPLVDRVFLWSHAQGVTFFVRDWGSTKEASFNFHHRYGGAHDSKTWTIPWQTHALSETLSEGGLR